MIEYVRDFNQKILGTVETLPNGNKIVRNYSCRIVATYDKKCDCTRSFECMIITKGDTAVGQLFNPVYNPDYK